MSDSTYFSKKAPVFPGKPLPEEGTVVGYAAIIDSLNLSVPLPRPITIVCKKNKKYQNEDWLVFPESYEPEDNKKLNEVRALYNQLVFALKYEGVNLLVFSFLAKNYSNQQLRELVNIEPTGKYARRIWFLIEWITGEELEGKENLSKKSYIPVVDEKLQYAVKGHKSPRHLVINNLPGNPDFCPLIRKTKKLENYIKADLKKQNNKNLKDIHRDILHRAAGFLLLKDSKASFTIEGESPKGKRAVRWSLAIGQAGKRELTREELTRLQEIAIENPRFLKMGFRKEGGFVGVHDRTTGEPIPDHISARWQDIDQLMDGLMKTCELLIKNEIDVVLAAALVSFGFVFIHPFEDGNGRIHRFLIHDVLARKRFSEQGFIFPVSASILDNIGEYRKVLEAYSLPLLEFIDWIETKDHNIEVRNETTDYYRFFDATEQAEFLYDCVNDTITNIIPNEISYLKNYDEFKWFLDEEFEMPDKMVDLLIRFLEQNSSKLSKRAREKEFAKLTDDEVRLIEQKYSEIFGN